MGYHDWQQQLARTDPQLVRCGTEYTPLCDELLITILEDKTIKQVGSGGKRAACLPRQIIGRCTLCLDANNSDFGTQVPRGKCNSADQRGITHWYPDLRNVRQLVDYFDGDDRCSGGNV